METRKSAQEARVECQERASAAFVAARDLPTWSELHGPSDPEIDAARVRAWRDADPAEKLAQMTALIEAARQLSEAGWRHRAADEQGGSG